MRCFSAFPGLKDFPFSNVSAGIITLCRVLPARKRVDRALLCVSGIVQCGSVSAVRFVAALSPRRIGAGLSPVDMKYVFIVITMRGKSQRRDRLQSPGECCEVLVLWYKSSRFEVACMRR